MKHLLSFMACSMLFCLLAMPNGYAATPAPKKDVPTNIKADKMDYNADTQTVVFTGKVFVKRPDFELSSSLLTVYLKKSGKKAESEDSLGGMDAGDIDRIVAQKNVIMKSEDKEGRCQTATFYADSNKFIMEGSPVLRDKENTIRGSKIVHYMDTNRSEVLGGVEANFLAPDKTVKDAALPSGKTKGTK